MEFILWSYTKTSKIINDSSMAEFNFPSGVAQGKYFCNRVA
ncbi:MAG: hypothetical protein AAGG80_03730 [Pseudomonadota bacterium]